MLLKSSQRASFFGVDMPAPGKLADSINATLSAISEKRHKEAREHLIACCDIIQEENTTQYDTHLEILNFLCATGEIYAFGTPQQIKDHIEQIKTLLRDSMSQEEVAARCFSLLKAGSLDEAKFFRSLLDDKQAAAVEIDDTIHCCERVRGTIRKNPEQLADIEKLIAAAAA